MIDDALGRLWGWESFDGTAASAATDLLIGYALGTSGRQGWWERFFRTMPDHDLKELTVRIASRAANRLRASGHIDWSATEPRWMHTRLLQPMTSMPWIECDHFGAIHVPSREWRRHRARLRRALLRELGDVDACVRARLLNETGHDAIWTVVDASDAMRTLGDSVGARALHALVSVPALWRRPHGTPLPLELKVQ